MEPNRRAISSRYLNTDGLIGVTTSSGDSVFGVDADFLTSYKPREMKFDRMNTKKCRHINQDERASLHSPAPDWHESNRGEELRHSTTLQILDILLKYKVDPVLP